MKKIGKIESAEALNHLKGTQEQMINMVRRGLFTNLRTDDNDVIERCAQTIVNDELTNRNRSNGKKS